MGVVYAGQHVVIQRRVAIKVLRHEYCQSKNLVARFIREARAASQIGHPNIVDVTDFGKLPNGQVYFVMEHLQGATLGGELRRLDKGLERMPLSRVIDLSLQMCRGLAAAHVKGIVHRDLKPENVFVVNPQNDTLINNEEGYRTDFVKLLDFGIAKFSIDSARITRLGSVIGTPAYMSPEQAAGKEVDHRGDIYSMGCLVHEMVTGHAPFRADTFVGTLTKHMCEPPPLMRDVTGDDIPAVLQATVLKMMEKNPANRYQSLKEVSAALTRSFREPPPDVAGPEPTFPPGPTKVARLPRLSADPARQSGAAARRATGPHPPASGEPHPAATAEPPQPLAEPRQRPTGPQTPVPMGETPRRPLITGPHQPVGPAAGVDSVPSVGIVTQSGASRSPAFAWVALGVALICMSLIAALLAWRLGGEPRIGPGPEPEPEPPQRIKTAAATGAAAAKPEAAGQPAETPDKRVTLRLETVPEGATVFLAGNALGVSPLTLELKPGERRVFRFRKEGFQDELLPVTAIEDAPPHVVALRAKQRYRRTRAGKRPRLPPQAGDLRDPFGNP